MNDDQLVCLAELRNIRRRTRAREVAEKQDLRTRNRLYALGKKLGLSNAQLARASGMKEVTVRSAFHQQRKQKENARG